MLRRFLMSAAAYVLTFAAASAGSTQMLTHTAPEGAELTFLLTDGRVLAQSQTDQHFYTLTPDINGSYVDGTWAKVADTPRDYAPNAGSSAVLADGRVLMIGGEYNFGEFDLTNRGAIYDPVVDKWKSLQPPPGNEWNYIGDSSCVVLPDGRFLIADKLNKALSAYDPKTGNWASLRHTGKSDFNAEESWTLLPDGRILAVDVKNQPNSEIYDPVTETWTTAGSTGVTLVQSYHIKIQYGKHLFYYAPGEVGPGMLLPDGAVYNSGSIPRHEKTAHSAIYKNGVWTPGPDIPNGDDAGDAGAVLLPSGNVLQATISGRLYEYDGTTFRKQSANIGASPMLLLPTGQVLVAGVEVYNARGAPKPSWAPTITAFPTSVERGTSYQISGKQFNGLSTANSFGDELQTFTNYPLVRITNTATGHVFYARTHDHSTMGVATGRATVSTNFDVSPLTEPGASTLIVVANGIPSKPVAITVN